MNYQHTKQVKMDPPTVSTDRFGSLVVIIKSSHLDDFQGLVRWINEKGFSETGLLKLRLFHEDREDERCSNEIITTMQQKFNETVVSKGQKKKFSYNPSCQTFYKASLSDHVYELKDVDCTPSQRKQFVDEAIHDSHYNNEDNCCTDCLSNDGLQGLRKHLFESIEHISDYVENLKQNNDALSTKTSTSSIVYGAGIPVNTARPVHICKNFTMIDLDDIINVQDGKFEGISYPYIYSGSLHSLFPWHIEDVALYSLNYVAKGSMKIWFGIAPSHFGLVDQIAQSFRISSSHSSCRVLLGDHKVLVADPQFFKDYHGVPYTMVVQEEGDFIMTFPYALHAGFNTGNNLAIAVNFADNDWIEKGIYAPTCNCFEHQVKFDFTKILKKFRPDLLHKYLTETSLLFPPDHPREVRRIMTSPLRKSADVFETGLAEAMEKPPKAATQRTPGGLSMTQVDGDTQLSSQKHNRPTAEKAGLWPNSAWSLYEKLVSSKSMHSKPRRFVSVTQKDVEAALGLGSSLALQPNTGWSVFEKVESSKSMNSKPHRFVPVTQKDVDDALGLGSSHYSQQLGKETGAGTHNDNDALCFCKNKSEKLMLSCNLCGYSFHSKCLNVDEQGISSSSKWYCKWCVKIKMVQEDYLKKFNNELARIKEERLLHYEMYAVHQKRRKMDMHHKEDYSE